MRRDNRRKSNKRKSFEAEKQNRIRSNEVNGLGLVVNSDLVEEDVKPVVDEIKLQVTGDEPEKKKEIKPSDGDASDVKRCEEKEENNHDQEENDTEINNHLNSESLVDPDLNGDQFLDPKNNENNESNEVSLDDSDKSLKLNEKISSTVNNKKDEELDENEKNRQKILNKAANEAALRLYSSFNQLAMQALLNVKQEASPEEQLPEKYMQNFLSTLSGGFLGLDEPGQDFLPENQRNSESPFTNMLRPPAEMSPDTFAKQFRYNDLASMVVCRGSNNKNMSGSADTGSTGIPKMGSSNSGQGNGAGSSLHQFVTRYTIERPDDPSKSGIEICLFGDDPSEPIIEVECGGNKGLLYVSKLCQGSKGQSILFNDDWLTPNEFQFISGRETAKDWKRSIRHCGKSLKTLMTKGFLQVHPPVCECDYCKGHGPATAEKLKKRSYIPHDRQLSNPDTMRSGGSTTSSSTESTTPISTGVGETPSIALHKPTGREGGLNSIISQLHNKQAICGSDVKTGNGEESLDLTIRTSSSSTSPAAIVNGRKRLREVGQKHFIGMDGDIEEAFLPMKRRHSQDDDLSDLDRSHVSEQRKSPKSSNSEPLCLSSQSYQNRKQAKNGFYQGRSPSRDRPNSSHSYNDKTDTAPNGHSSSGRKLYPSTTTPPAQTGSNFYSDFYKSARNYQSNINYGEHALLDAMKRAVANVTANSFSDRVRTPPSPPLSRHLSTGSSTNRHGFINLDSTSRRFDAASPHRQSVKDQPMVELTSHRRMNGGRFYEQYDYNRRRSTYANNVESHKVPVTVLHHRPNSFHNSLPSGHRQASSGSSHSAPFFPMPPPFYHGSDAKFNQRSLSDRYRYSNSAVASRVDKKMKGKLNNRKMTSGDDQRRSHAVNDMPMQDLDNRSVPMLCLTYSNKKKPRSFYDKDRNGIDYNTNVSRHPERSQSAFNADNKNSTSCNRKVVSDDEMSRKNDSLRRQSSSAPPPLFNDAVINESKLLDENKNEKTSKDIKDEVFQLGRPRAKSASPLATRSHPYFDGSRAHRSSSSLDPSRPDSNLSYFPNSFDGSPTFMQQFEMLRWRDMCEAVEDMGYWTVDDVCGFLSNIGCDQYQKVFRENQIDGDALPLLMEHHLVNKMGLKLGHALKVMARTHRRLGNHCALIKERLGLSQLSPFRPPLTTMNSLSESSDLAPAPIPESVGSPSPEAKEEVATV